MRGSLQRPTPLTPLLMLAALLGGCNPSPSPAVTAQPGPTVRPSFDAPGSPSALTPDQIRAEIEPLLGQSAISVGEGANRVIAIGLRANAEALARELVARYGTAVEVTVGLFPYPPPTAPQDGCAFVREVTPDHRPLAAGLVLEPTVPSGGFYKGTVRITNTGPAPFALDTESSFSVYLFRPGEDVVIGVSEGGVMGTGYGKTLAPREALDLPAGGGTASCDLAVGYVLPAGAYVGRALVGFADPITLEFRWFWSEPAPIQVVNR
jgi:hypothetical protein